VTAFCSSMPSHRDGHPQLSNWIRVTHYLLIWRDGFEIWIQDINLKPGASSAIGAHLKAVEQQPQVIVVQPAQLRTAEQQGNVIIVPSQAK
jgi:hypothetical protein